MDQDLLARFRFFHENAGYVVGRRAVCALALARAERRAEAEGLSVQFIYEDEPWDGDCPAPNHVVLGFVRDPAEDGPGYGALASLGMIGFDSWTDPYLRVVKAEILSAAFETLDDRREEAACREAAELSARATYAGVAP